MNERVLILRDAVVKITQMLTGRGITVTQRGINAYVQCDRSGRPTLVNLPYLPDNATEELCLAIQGFLDHEVAHIMFSDFSLLEEAGKLGVHSMLNILEDARIEKCMAQRFTGSGHNLSVTGKFFLDKYTVPMMQEAAAAGDANKVIATLMVPLIRAMSGQFIFKEFMDDKMHIVQEVHDKIADLAPKIEAATTTRECLELAKEIEGRLRSKGPKGSGDPKKPADEGDADEEDDGEVKSLGGKGKDKKEEKPKKDKGDDEGKPKKDEDEEGDEKQKGGTGEEKKPDEDEEGDPEAAGGKKDEEADEDEEGGEGSGAGPDDEDEEDEEGSPTPSDDGEGEDEDPADEGEGDGEDDEDEGVGDAEDGSDDDDETGSEEETGNTAAVWEELDKNGKNPFDAALSNLISNAACDAAKEASYLIYTKEGDTIEPLTVGSGYDSRMLADLADKVDHMVGPLQKDLERAIAARSLATWEAGRRSGRLHAANLSRLAVGDARVFRKRHETTSKDVAVSLVIDASGSMAGSKIHLATQSAYALSSVLERIGISHEVIAFTTGTPVADSHTLEMESRKIGRSFTRVESLYMPVLKGFNERLKTDVKERFGWLPNSRILRNNIDGECIEVAARRLLSRREAGKVMIVLSDGSPNAAGDTYALSRHLKKVVGDVSKMGVKIVGIGINSTEVQKFYPKNTVINNVSELPDRVIKELRHLLVS